MINDTTMCKIAKKLNGISPSKVIDDPTKVYDLLLEWWHRDSADSCKQIKSLTKTELRELNSFFRGYLGVKRED